MVDTKASLVDPENIPERPRDVSKEEQNILRIGQGQA